MNESPEESYRSSGRAKPTSPDSAELRAKLDNWILWVKERIPVSGDIPTVLDLFLTALNDSNGKDLLLAAVPEKMSAQNLESWWGDILAQSHADLALRVGILVCAWWELALLEAELEEWGNPPDPDEVFLWGSVKDNCERARETLALLVRFLPVEDCNTTWREFRWEILNSYLIHDWNRAADFFNRAEALGLRSSGEIAALRGQFRFLVVFGDDIEKRVRRILKKDELRLRLDLLFWNLEIYGSGGSEEDGKAQLLLEGGMCDADRDLVLNASLRQLSLDAANDLQKAFLSLGDLPYPYRAMLARCHYCTGHFHEAAEQYYALSQSQGQSGQPRAGRRLFASLSLSYRQAGETERAKEILGRWAREFPGEKGVYLQLAELEAQGADYQAAVEYLRKEIDRNPAVDKDWKLSALLALGTTQDTSEAIKNELMDNSDLWNPVVRMLSEYWAPFSKLGEKGREKWTFGVVLANSSGLPEQMRLNEAAVACIGAVEIELRDRVFGKYKEHVLKHASLKATAEKGGMNRPSSKLCQFLVHDGGLTLGEMAFILKVCARDDEPVLRELRNWISRTQFRVIQNVYNLEALVAFRNPAVHENRVEVNPKDIIRSCRAFIEALN